MTKPSLVDHGVDVADLGFRASSCDGKNGFARVNERFVSAVPMKPVHTIAICFSII
jgi:hypothetical protein